MAPKKAESPSTELLEEQATLQAQIEQLRAQLEKLQAEKVIPETEAGTSSTQNMGPKIKPPEQFADDGKTTAGHYILQLDSYFASFSSHISDEKKRKFFLANLTGSSPLSWAETHKDLNSYRRCRKHSSIVLVK